ncbi:MAG: head morphogenesis protein, partial [Eubacteriaceae bacterium]
KNKGYTTINIYNTWNYEFYPYKGINTVVKTPDGIVFELQYHTPESYKLKNGELHKLYEKQRLLEDTSSDEYIELNNKMIELSNILTKPIGIERIISQ